jgi:hypothetical protein
LPEWYKFSHKAAEPAVLKLFAAPGVGDLIRFIAQICAAFLSCGMDVGERFISIENTSLHVTDFCI